MTEFSAWLIFLIPMTSFLVIALIIRPFFNRYSQVAGYITIASVAVSFLLSLWALGEVRGVDGPIGWPAREWLSVGPLTISFGILFDSLTAIMAVVVTGVSLMVQIYSKGYMKGDQGYARYYCFMSLFTASMLGLLMARNILQMYFFWELVGLSSYLLIGFWYQRPAAARAAMKAFLVTRLGDLGFLVAILYLFFHQDALGIHGLNALDIPDIHAAASAGLIGATALTWIAIGIFAGAAGKSAQFPLHVWLPDAMEGPTPVSALIHAATMVAAGVFLVARFFPVFVVSADAMRVVALIGGFTAIFAASMALVMYDIKRVVAYSTISQLGYMMLALGLGGYAVAIFHLFTHAFFKALLFLGAGSVNHSTGTFDMRYMGGLRRYQPWTYRAFLIGAFSLAGIFPFSGFWSKDEILVTAWMQDGLMEKTLFVVAALTVFMTAFYIFRVVFMTFHGNFRGGVDEEIRQTESLGGDQRVPAAKAQSGVHPHESPVSMVMPMLLLATLSIGIGFVTNAPSAVLSLPKHWMANLLGASLVPSGIHPVSPEIDVVIAIIGLGLALAGIGIAWFLYGRESQAAGRIGLPVVHRLLTKKYYLDTLYEDALTANVFYAKLCAMVDWFDRNVLDEFVEKTGWLTKNIGRAIVLLQTGQLQAYGMAMVIGVGAIVFVYYIWG
jgi:NADH-quinone oxidoreductase subunit L